MPSKMPISTTGWIAINWDSPNPNLPREGIRVVIYSPCYKKNSPEEFRMVDSQFVRICKDASHWAEVIRPGERATRVKRLLIPLTGKQLKYAAEHKLKVRCVERAVNPHDSWKNYNKVSIMEPAKEGYYIGDTDVDPSNYADDQLVEEHDIDGNFFGIYQYHGVNYDPEKEKDES